MLTVKELKEILEKHDDNTIVLLFDDNKKELGREPNTPHNSFQDLLEIHVCSLTYNNKPIPIKRRMINKNTNEIVPILTNEPEGIKALFLSPDKIQIYKEEDKKQ